MQARHKTHSFDPWAGKIPWRWWQSTPLFLPGESHGQRSLLGYSSQDCTESDTAEATYHTQHILLNNIHKSPIEIMLLTLLIKSTNISHSLKIHIPFSKTCFQDFWDLNPKPFKFCLLGVFTKHSTLYSLEKQNIVLFSKYTTYIFFSPMLLTLSVLKYPLCQ